MRLERGNLSKVGISQGYRSSPPLVSINFAISATLGDILRRGAMTRRHIRLIAPLSHGQASRTYLFSFGSSGPWRLRG